MYPTPNTIYYKQYKIVRYRMIYLDNAATSRFKPRCMFDEMFKQLSYSSNPGRGGHNDSIDTAIKIYDTRQLLKGLLNCSDDYELIFTSGCTEASNMALIGYLLNFKDKDCEVIFTSNEHNSVARPLYHLSQTYGIKLIEVLPDQNGQISPIAVKEAITKNTRLICVNHISNVTGNITEIGDIGKIAKAHSIPFFVDAAQSLGHTKLDIQENNIDFLVAAGHKGLHGSQGTGFLVYNTKYKLFPIKFGGTGSHSESLIQPDLPPDAFESGTVNSAGIIGLGASANWTYQNLSKIMLNTKYLTSELIYGLKQIKNIRLYSSHNSGVVSFNYKDFSSTDIGDYLNDNNVAVRCGLHCAPLIHRQLGTLESGTVRVSIGYNNSISDIHTLLRLVDNLNYRN